MKIHKFGRMGFVLLLALYAGVFALLGCSGSTSSDQADYDWDIRIGFMNNDDGSFVFQGHYIDVPVILDSMPDVDIDSFSFLIAYDPKALTFITSERSEMLSGWDEFSFSQGDFEYNSDSTMGLFKITGKRQSSSEYEKSGIRSGEAAKGMVFREQEMFTIKFWVTDDRNYECLFIPVNFFWLECNDNTIYYNSGRGAAYSENVFCIDWLNWPDWRRMLPEDGTVDEDDHLYGAFDDCWNGTSQNDSQFSARIDFYNGGVDISCADSIDYITGDIDLNKIPYEIGDAVLFANYFILGDSVFVIDKDKQILATDVNHDNIYLTLADFDYLARVITGDGTFPGHLRHDMDTVSVAIAGDIHSFSSGIDLGAALFVFDGDVDFDVLDTNFEVKSDYISGKTRILLYSLEGAKFKAGRTSILSSSALQQLDSCQFSGYYGNVVVTGMSK